MWSLPQRNLGIAAPEVGKRALTRQVLPIGAIISSRSLPFLSDDDADPLTTSDVMGASSLVLHLLHSCQDPASALCVLLRGISRQVT
jgi:hypothetical protein